jgi:hypothetical protein
MPFAYFERLSAARKRIYLESDAIHEVGLPRDLALARTAARIREALASEQRQGVEAASQALMDTLCRALEVPAVRVKVHAVRPNANWGELHGLYEPFDARPSQISVWMRTARQKKVVAFRTFLRTLLHELCHHLDYELYRLPETFHTEGFYKRESSLLHRVLGEAPRPDRA